MKEENFKKILERPELNASGLAAKMYPGKTGSKTRLFAKVKNLKQGNGHARLTEEDLAKAWEVLKDLADDIYSKGPQQ